MTAILGRTSRIDSLRSPVGQVQVVLGSYRECPVYHFTKKKVVKTGEEFWVELSGPVLGRLEELLGVQG